MSLPPGSPEPVEREKRQRLFFALWPDDAVRTQLAGLAARAARHNGRVVAECNLHLTLAYIGSTVPAMRDCMVKQVAALQSSPFTLHFDHAGYWPRPKIAWLSPAQVPEALSTLHQDLCTRLAFCGYEPESRPFRPHVTLVRKVRHKPNLEVPEPVVWHVNRLCLAESITDPAGARYEVIAGWELGALPAESV